MTGPKTKRYATLPNCDGCGRFTSNPEVRSECVGANGFIACYEQLLCKRCATTEAKPGITTKEDTVGFGGVPAHKGAKMAREWQTRGVA